MVIVAARFAIYAVIYVARSAEELRRGSARAVDASADTYSALYDKIGQG